MQLFYTDKVENGSLWLNEEERHHCHKVLRKQAGEQLNATDGVGNLYTGVIESINQKEARLRITETLAIPKWDYFVHLAIAPTKNTDRLEFFVEKAVEIGIDQISIMYTSHSERKNCNLDRLQKIAISAAKQSGKVWFTKITEEKKFENMLSRAIEKQRYIATLGQNTKNIRSQFEAGSSYLILIGPEGDFTENEVTLALNTGFIPLSLGPYRLRTETAGIVACQMLNFLNQG